MIGEGKGCCCVLINIPIPREATSVATMIGLFPVLNSFRTQSRSFCCLSPWIAERFSQSVWSVYWERKGGG